MTTVDVRRPDAADTRRLLLGLAACAATLAPVRNGRVGTGELTVFRAANDLPDWLFPPAWLVMQAGALGAVPVSAAAAAVVGHPRLALELGLAGGSAYLLAKGVKRLVRRGRPAELLGPVRLRGKPAGGRGYLSGHAAVAAALAGTARPALSRVPGRAVVAAGPVVGLTRLYVGAHLPWDVAGGLALGWEVASALVATRRQGTGPAGIRGRT